MSGEVMEEHCFKNQPGVEKLKAEVVVLGNSLAELERQNLRSSIFVQKLGRFFAFGAAGKLEWARFKLNFKQEQLDDFMSVEMPEAKMALQPQVSGRLLETARQKMERMIAENPAELEPHIRRVYQPHID